MENLLSSLNVENLVLPAAEEAESIWTNKFGFTKMTEQQVSENFLFFRSLLFGKALLWSDVLTKFMRVMHIYVHFGFASNSKQSKWCFFLIAVAELPKGSTAYSL